MEDNGLLRVEGMKAEERYRGAMLGLATGDALGTTLEFTTPGSFAPLTDMVGGGPFQLQPGQWTDDTSMALCLAESLLACRGFDPVHQMTLYRRWMREGYLSSTGVCFDIGNATREAIVRHERTEEGYCGSDSPSSAGNGSLMRLAPIALYYAADPATAIRYAAESSRVTHATRECLDACKLFAAYLVAALQGQTKEEMLAPNALERWLGQEALAPAIAEIHQGSFWFKEPPVIQGSGYVVKSLEAALWAFSRSTSFVEGALLAVNLGDDADTTGAVYGQLAGAYYGVSAIPEEWVDKLALGDTIRQLADQLLVCSREQEQ